MVIHVTLADEWLHQDATAYVYAHNVWNYLVAQVARKTNDAACPGMYVGHDAYFTLAEHIDGQQLFDLFAGTVLDVVRIDFYVITFYSFHLVL